MCSAGHPSALRHGPQCLPIAAMPICVPIGQVCMRASVWRVCGCDARRCSACLTRASTQDYKLWLERTTLFVEVWCTVGALPSSIPSRAHSPTASFWCRPCSAGVCHICRPVISSSCEIGARGALSSPQVVSSIQSMTTERMGITRDGIDGEKLARGRLRLHSYRH